MCINVICAAVHGLELCYCRARTGRGEREFADERLPEIVPVLDVVNPAFWYSAVHGQDEDRDDSLFWAEYARTEASGTSLSAGVVLYVLDCSNVVGEAPLTVLRTVAMISVTTSSTANVWPEVSVVRNVVVETEARGGDMEEDRVDEIGGVIGVGYETEGEVEENITELADEAVYKLGENA